MHNQKIPAKERTEKTQRKIAQKNRLGEIDRRNPMCGSAQEKLVRNSAKSPCGKAHGKTAAKNCRENVPAGSCTKKVTVKKRSYKNTVKKQMVEDLVRERFEKAISRPRERAHEESFSEGVHKEQAPSERRTVKNPANGEISSRRTHEKSSAEERTKTDIRNSAWKKPLRKGEEKASGKRKKREEKDLAK